jgi:hypothetical protein
MQKKKYCWQTKLSENSPDEESSSDPSSNNDDGEIATLSYQGNSRNLIVWSVQHIFANLIGIWT